MSNRHEFTWAIYLAEAVIASFVIAKLRRRDQARIRNGRRSRFWRDVAPTLFMLAGATILLLLILTE